MRKIEFTRAEILNLLLAAGNILDYEDMAKSLFPNKHSRDAAYRAYRKLSQALKTRPRPVKPRRK